MNPYLPEGSLIRTEQNKSAIASIDALARAMEQQTVLEATAIRCDSGHNLHVALGCGTGFIPREDTALGIDDGSVKEISVLSRVGKPVAFTVTGLVANDGFLTPVLSRKAAQIQAMKRIRAQAIGSVLIARITRLEHFGAFVDVGCGLISMIPIDRISVSRITHPGWRFAVGQEIPAVYLGIEERTGHILLSHRELLGTWAENAALFHAGETVTGTVRGIQDYGCFVELAPNLTGLAEPFPTAKENQRVSVFIKSIQPEKRKIKLTVIDTLEGGVQPEPLRYWLEEENYAGWDYFSSSDLTVSQ